MLPIITVGLTEPARALLERIPGERSTAHFDTAEEALWDLGSDRAPGMADIQLDAKGERWSCHVFYGDRALGPLLTATKETTVPTRVPAQGLTAVVTDSLGSDPTTPYRVIEGTPEKRQPPTLSAVDALMVLRGGVLLVVDQVNENPNWPRAVQIALDNAEPGPVEPLGFTPGAEAKAELARLEGLRARGMTRPGHFEGQARSGGLLP